MPSVAVATIAPMSDGRDGGAQPAGVPEGRPVGEGSPMAAVSSGPRHSKRRGTERARVRRRRLAAASTTLLALVVVGVLVAMLLAPSGHPGARPNGRVNGRASRYASGKSGARTGGRSGALARGRGPSTFPGPDGLEARWVVDQNKLPGTTAWKITNAPAGSTIDGFANLAYAADGQSVTLYVSSQAPRFHVDAYRMGYYGGTGARLVWRSSELKGVVQPPCPLTPGVNMVACDNWAPSLVVHLTSAFVQGDYLFKLVGSGNQQSYVPLTVWDPTSHAAYIVKNDIFTWQAWNPYGGYDYYTGVGSCPPGHYPLCSRARVVSFDRPYAYGQGAGDFLANEYPLVYWAEKHGLDVTYWTDLTVVQHPSLLANHRTILSLGHDECWSLRERQAVENANHSGGLNVVFFAASPMLRHVRLQASPLGPDREEVDYRNSAKDPLNGKGNPLEVTGNTWGSPPANWAEDHFVGEAYGGYTLGGVGPQPFVVADGNAWIFDGTGLRTGSSVPGVVMSDFDSFDPALAHPANLQVLGHSPLPAREVQTDLPTVGGFAYSDMTYYTNPSSGGGVFDSGTNNWIYSMRTCSPGESPCPAHVLRKITGNLLRLFGQGPAGRFTPSVANWQSFPG